MDSAIKYLSFIAAIAVLSLGALFAYFSFRTPPQSAPIEETSAPPDLFGPSSQVNTAQGGIAQAQPASSETNIDITNRDGRTISVRPFLPGPNATSTKSVDATGATAVVPLYWGANASFSIVYNGTNDFFGIGLLAEPINQARKNAETYVLELLGVSQEEACRLNYSLFVMANVNPVYAGKNLGFSFCPGAIGL